MRSIIYIDPVESVRGNLGSKQNLLYPTKNNKAFFAPSGATSAANNYGTRMIGMRRDASGRNYYAIRKKSSFHATSQALKNCSLMGATCSIRNVLLHNINIMSQIQMNWKAYRDSGGEMNLEQWIYNIILEQIKLNPDTLVLAGLYSTVNLGVNPYGSEFETAIGIPYEIFRKFANYINSNWKNFNIRGLDQGCVKYTGQSWSNWMSTPRCNIWGFQAETTMSNPRVLLGDYCVVNAAGEPVHIGEVIQPGDYSLKYIGG